MKKTAVEWLAEQMLWNEFHNPYLEKAKEINKEQIMNSFADGFVEGVETQKSGEQLLFPQQYYKEIYEKK